MILASLASHAHTWTIGITDLLLKDSSIERGRRKTPNQKLVGSLDVIIRMLDDPGWSQKAKRVRSMSELRRILVDFCNAEGEAVQIDRDTLWLHIGARMKGNSGA